MMQKVAIITAASSGMGAAIARKLDALNYKLVLMSNSEKIVLISEELGAKCMQGSVKNVNDLQKLVELAQTTYGRVDVVVNNTGHPAKGNLLAISDDEWLEGMELVLLNVIRMARLVTPIMRNLGGGSIINISTFSAFEPSLQFPVSSTFRAALASYTKLYSDQYGISNIRMNNILPGFINSYPIEKSVKNKIPLKRVGKVEEIANTVAFLASEEAGYITGQNIKVDGGLGRSV